MFNSLIYPFEWLVAWILYGWHALLTTVGLDPASGLAWGLSIVGLVVVMRGAMIPLFVKQIHASRRMQLIQPEMKKIQDKYKGKTDPESRQKMSQETMDLYKRTGTNPFSSCMPVLIQMPFFFGLFRVLNNLEPIAEGKIKPIGPITRELAQQAEASTMFGAQLSDKFMGADTLNTQVVTILLIVLMSITTFTSQHQLMRKNMPEAALNNQYAQTQKMMLYVLPVIFAVSGINFPIGVLIYWAVTNFWSMVQQFYVIRNMPTPGTPAERALHERRRAKGKEIPAKPTLADITRKGAGATDAGIAREDGDATGGTTVTEPVKVSRQRQQPKGKKRAKATGAAKPARQAGQPRGGEGARAASDDAAGASGATSARTDEDT